MFEEDDDAKIPRSPDANQSLSKSWSAHFSVHNSVHINNQFLINKCDHAELIDDFQDIIFNLVCFLLENSDKERGHLLNSVKFEKIMITIKRHHGLSNYDNSLDSQLIKCDRRRSILSERPSKFEKISEDGANFKEAAKLASKIKFLETILSELLNNKSTKLWSRHYKTPTVTFDPWPRPFQTMEQLKILAREAGFPNELRAKLWFSLISNRLNDHFDAADLLDAARGTIEKYANIITDADERSDEIESIIRQIDLDVHRTMPGHAMFASEVGISKLRLILVAYSVHVNPMIGYCQAMNFIGALCLVTFNGNEVQSLMGLVCVIDHIFPPQYYDHHLTGKFQRQTFEFFVISALFRSAR